MFCKLLICLNSGTSGSKTGEGLLNLHQFFTQDKITHILLEAQKTFGQFGKGTEASTSLVFSAEKKLIGQSRIW